MEPQSWIHELFKGNYCIWIYFTKEKWAQEQFWTIQKKRKKNSLTFHLKKMMLDFLVEFYGPNN